ncbi:MAG: hypothetical protein NVS4B12_14040 [Ktedonobacteraceae bacterium]
MLEDTDAAHALDILFINSPIKNYDISPRYNDFTLPVLGLAYIATYVREQGFAVDVLDAEALGLGISKIIATVNACKPRWVGLNLLAPTYRHSIEILRGLDPNIAVMLGGHQAKAMPTRILHDTQIPRIDALILGEGEYRTAEIIKYTDNRKGLPHVWWRDSSGEVCQGRAPSGTNSNYWLAPDINTLPFVDREFLVQDPFTNGEGVVEANLVGSRGCPYDCSFCGAAISANPDVTIRTRDPLNIVEEMQALAEKYSVRVFRFVDDLFLASPPFMRKCLSTFNEYGIGERFQWDATGRINILSKAPASLLDLMRQTGCREVALGIESGSARLLRYMGKHITPDMTKEAVRALTSRGINVKGYFILGFPTETEADLEETVHLIHDLWNIGASGPGMFRCSVFEFRPYPGTPEWHRLIATDRYREEDLLRYESVDLTEHGKVQEMLERDEFNFSVNQQFGDVSIDRVRQYLTEIMVEQKQRLHTEPDHVQRLNLALRV